MTTIQVYLATLLILVKITFNLSRIISGEETIPNQYPFQVAIVAVNPNYMDYFCSGSIISNKWVLTAGHCLEQIDPEYVMVYYGVHILVSQFEPSYLLSHKIEKKDFYIHPQYENSKENLFIPVNDIALLRLPEKIEFNDKIGYINLPFRSEINKNLTGKEVTTSGWGETETELFSFKLLHITVPIISNSRCKETFKNEQIRDTVICILNKEKTTCRGDSGGPLIYETEHGRQQTLIGVTSAGDCENIAVYMKVSSYLDWISKITGIKIKD